MSDRIIRPLFHPQAPFRGDPGFPAKSASFSSQLPPSHVPPPNMVNEVGTARRKELSALNRDRFLPCLSPPDPARVLFVIGCCLSLVVVCCWSLFVLGHCLSLVVVYRWLLFVAGCCLSLVIVCRQLLFVVVCCWSLVVVCRWSLFVVGRCFFVDHCLSLVVVCR